MELTARLPRYDFTGNDQVDIRLTHTLPATRKPLTYLHWEALSNAPDADADALAYRIETLVIRRRMEDKLRRTGAVPRALYIGTSEKIGAMLNATGDAVKQSISRSCRLFVMVEEEYRNAWGKKTSNSALPAHLLFYMSTSTQTADGYALQIWIRFDELHIQSLDFLPPRPFDYEYAKSLAPASLRAYEVLSYAIFEAAKEDKYQVVMPYLDFCVFTAQPRHVAYEDATQQMQCLLAPLLESRHLASIQIIDSSDNYLREEERNTESDLLPTWNLRVELGTQALNDFQSFSFEDEGDVELDEPATPDFDKIMREDAEELMLAMFSVQ